MPKSAPNPAAPAAHALLERGMAEPIVGSALVGVFQDLVGFVDFLEAMLGILVAGVAIGMAGHGLLAERGFDVAVVRGALDRESFVGQPAISPDPRH